MHPMKNKTCVLDCQRPSKSLKQLQSSASTGLWGLGSEPRHSVMGICRWEEGQNPETWGPRACLPTRSGSCSHGLSHLTGPGEGCHLVSIQGWRWTGSDCWSQRQEEPGPLCRPAPGEHLLPWSCPHSAGQQLSLHWNPFLCRCKPREGTSQLTLPWWLMAGEPPNS